MTKLALLEKRLTCGHRQVDMDDASGGCVFCIYRAGYEEYEARLARVVVALRSIEGELRGKSYMRETARAALAAERGLNEAEEAN